MWGQTGPARAPILEQGPRPGLTGAGKKDGLGLRLWASLKECGCVSGREGIGASGRLRLRVGLCGCVGESLFGARRPVGSRGLCKRLSNGTGAAAEGASEGRYLRAGSLVQLSGRACRSERTARVFVLRMSGAAAGYQQAAAHMDRLAKPCCFELQGRSSLGSRGGRP